MSLLLDVLEILPSGPVRRILLTHVAEPPCEFGEFLTVSALTEPIDGKMRRLGEGWAREHCDLGIFINHVGLEAICRRELEKGEKSNTRDYQRCDRARPELHQEAARDLDRT